MSIADSPVPPAVAAAVAKLVPADVERVEPAGGGANSRLYRVRTAAANYALKAYPELRDDRRDRARVERRALEFLAAAGGSHAPVTPRFCGAVPGYSLLSWIDGQLALPPADEDVRAAADFLRHLHTLRHAPSARTIPFAYEALQSAQVVFDDLEARFARLRTAAATQPELHRLLECTIAPLHARAVARATRIYAAAGVALDARDDARYTLISGDFGFHNCMRRPDGTLAFIDFEYFGWDDPAKVSCDVLAHPALELPPAQFVQFRNLMLELYGADPFFAQRLEAWLPLVGLRWVSIICNEFLPERFAARPLVAGQPSWELIKARQLDRAERYVQRALFEECR